MTTEDVLFYGNVTETSMIYSTISVPTTQNPLTYENTIKIPVIFRNCSVYNPCGRYGNCRNDLNNSWRCVCKFWWNGTLCNELSNSGSQVIALGVMLGIVIALFYGLTLFRFINKKRKLPKNDEKENIPTINRKFLPISTTVFDPTRRILSWITSIATIILAGCTLIAKWSILKPIHEEMVNKFYDNQTIFFKRHSVCEIIDSSEFNLFTFPVACLLILIFTIITKSVSFRRKKYCKGYIGIPIPIDFFAHVKRSLAAVVFAIFADELLDIANQLFKGEGLGTGQGIIVAYLIQISKVVISGLRRYPILAALYINNCLSLICATLYVWLDFSITIVHNGLCRSDFYPTDKNFNETEDTRAIRYLNYYGTGSKLLFFQLLTDIPRYLCLAYISIKLPILLYKRIRDRNLIDRKLTSEQKNLLYSSLPHSVETRYVKKLLGMSNRETPTTRFAEIFRFIYLWRDDFRFSSRIICVFASVFLLLFFLTVQACVQIPPKLKEIQDTFQEYANLLSLMSNSADPNLQEPEDPSADFPLPDFIRPYLFAVIIGSIITCIQLLIMLAGIRRNLLQAFRGDDSELPRRISSNNVSYVTGNFHFAGYFIGYLILSYLLIVFIALIIGVAIDAFITYGSVGFLEWLLEGIIPILLFTTFKLFLNKFLGQYVFLQHSGDVLSINNRRSFMVFIYFNFFLDAFLGFIAAVLRILKSIIGGIFYMCRLDYSPLGRKLETMDDGFNAYCGLIQMECAHRHPVLLCFASHLLRDHLYAKTTKRLSKARHKWYLAVFLLNNPILIYRRKGFLTRLQMNDITMMLNGEIHDKEIFVERPPILAHRASIISEKELEDLWQRRNL